MNLIETFLNWACGSQKEKTPSPPASGEQSEDNGAASDRAPPNKPKKDEVSIFLSALNSTWTLPKQFSDTQPHYTLPARPCASHPGAPDLKQKRHSNAEVEQATQKYAKLQADIEKMKKQKRALAAGYDIQQETAHQEKSSEPCYCLR